MPEKPPFKKGDFARFITGQGPILVITGPGPSNGFLETIAGTPSGLKRFCIRPEFLTRIDPEAETVDPLPPPDEPMRVIQF